MLHCSLQPKFQGSEEDPPKAGGSVNLIKYTHKKDIKKLTQKV